MKSKNQSLHVVYLGESGFPIGLAAIQKMTLIGKSLIHAGAKVTVLNRKGKFEKDEKVDVPLEGEHEGIKFFYTSGTIHRPIGFWKRNWQKIKGKIAEYQRLKYYKKQGDDLIGIISTESFFQTLTYYLYAKILKFPIVFNYVEMQSSMEHRTGLYLETNDYLMDNFMIKRMDAALPISEILKDNFNKIAPNKPIFKIPVLCDFSLFDVPKDEGKAPYFLYCGSLAYKEVVDFILEAYAKISQTTDIKLALLVSGGKSAEYEQLQKDIAQKVNPEKVHVYKNIPYSQLIDLYVNAKALLIPLRPTLQDAARFPHKIGEYLATGNPIVTTNYGEVAHYFQDKENALIADNYEVDEYVEKLHFVINEHEKANEIGKNGKTYGLNEFDYLSYGQKLKHFLENLI